MTQARAFPAVVGERVAAIRRFHDLRQEDLARRMRRVGFLGWTADTVTAVEVGRRLPDLRETIGLGAVLGYGAAELLGADNEILTGPDGNPLLRPDEEGPMDVAFGKQVLKGEPAWAAVAPHGPAPEPSPIVGPGDRKAARRLEIPPQELLRRSQRRWGRTLAEERDERVEERLPAGATPHTARAFRGHITRQLLAELATEEEA